MKRLNKTETPIFVLSGYFCFQELPLWILSATAAGVKCHVVSIKSLPVHHSVVIIFFFLGIIEPILVSWKIECC